jgi:soluble lytic murein transglycosylase-like protein
MSKVQSAIFPGLLLGCALIIFLSAAAPDNVSLVYNNYQQSLASAKPIQTSSNPAFNIGSSISNGFQKVLAIAKPIQNISNNVSSVSNRVEQTQVVANPVQASSGTSGSCGLANNYSAAIRQWCGPVTQYAQQYNLDPNLIAAVIEIESGGNPQAYSHSGAVGLMQIMPRDGIAAGFLCGGTSCFASRPSSSELLSPDANIAYGARMLASLIQRYGNTRDALYRYGPINDGYSYADRVLQIYQSHR